MAFKMKGFEPHNMYKTEKAETHKEHLDLKEKGFDHSPYNKMDALHNGKPGVQQEDFEQFSAMKKKSTPCWDTHTNIVNGKQTFKKKGGKMVPDCKPKK
jgi:hypothetical protein|tara:strand:- start:2408 stop:2704 length:297 start_codon:yes stop_codon:yes gene_type:complete